MARKEKFFTFVKFVAPILERFAGLPERSPPLVLLANVRFGPGFSASVARIVGGRIPDEGAGRRLRQLGVGMPLIVITVATS